MTASIETVLTRFVQTPGGQVALLFAALTIVYLLIVRFIRVSVPFRYDSADEEEDGPEADTSAEARPEPKDDEVVPECYRPEPVVPVPAPKELAAGAYPAPAPPPRVEVRALQVGDVEFAIGDTASKVMRAFAPGADQPAPLIERGVGQRAWHVSRTYTIGDRTIALAFERGAMKEPLRLISIRVENAGT